jgi:cell division protein FtsI/penicillin-binding protein 2
LLITPLQAAVMAAALANGGSLVHPRVVAQVGERTTAATTTTSLEWNPSHLAMVREGMRAVVNDPAGTGIYAHSEMVVIAGKTGTAQTHRPGLAHGWFIGFCPAEEPIAAFAIVAEFGGTGGDLPARIGKAICEYLAHPEEMEARATAGAGG